MDTVTKGPEPTSADYPEHDKLSKVSPQSQSIGEFIEWLGAKGIRFAIHHEHSDNCILDGRLTCGIQDSELVPYHFNTNTLLAEYFNIDLSKIDEEKKSMLARLQRITSLSNL